MTSVPAARPAEQRTWHNRLQKLALAVDDSREYWRNADPSARPDEENLRAFTERWFGGKTMARVRVLMADFRSRYAAYPQALEVLRNLRGAHPDLLRLVCHWHLQLADPAYRTFTGVWLPERRSFEATVGNRHQSKKLENLDGKANGRKAALGSNRGSVDRTRHQESSPPGAARPRRGHRLLDAPAAGD